MEIDRFELICAETFVENWYSTEAAKKNPFSPHCSDFVAIKTNS